MRELKYEFYGWAVLDKYGVPVETITSISNVRDEIDICTELRSEQDIINKWNISNISLAPYTIEKLYLHYTS